MTKKWVLFNIVFRMEDSKKYFSKEIKLFLGFVFGFGIVTILVFALVIRISLGTLLSHLASENLQLRLLSEELKKEIQLYKEVRNANDIKLFRQMIALRSDIATALNQKEKTLGASTQATPSSRISPLLLGILRIKENRFEKIEIFAEPRASSKIIGEIPTSEPITIYFFSEKTPGWYKIEYKEGKWGWISEQFVEELYD